MNYIIVRRLFESPGIVAPRPQRGRYPRGTWLSTGARVVTEEAASNYFSVSASRWALGLSCSFVWRSASNDDSMETGSERQKMQRKGEAAEKTRGNDSALFPCAHGLRVCVDDASM